jgi:hypothetical protein
VTVLDDNLSAKTDTYAKRCLGQTVSAAYSGHISKHELMQRIDNGIAIPTLKSFLTGLASLYQEMCT